MNYYHILITHIISGSTRVYLMNLPEEMIEPIIKDVKRNPDEIIYAVKAL